MEGNHHQKASTSLPCCHYQSVLSLTISSVRSTVGSGDNIKHRQNRSTQTALSSSMRYGQVHRDDSSNTTPPVVDRNGPLTSSCYKRFHSARLRSDLRFFDMVQPKSSLSAQIESSASTSTVRSSSQDYKPNPVQTKTPRPRAGKTIGTAPHLLSSSTTNPASTTVPQPNPTEQSRQNQ